MANPFDQFDATPVRKSAPKPVSRQERQSAKFAALPQPEAQRVLKVAEEAFLRPFAGKSESVRMKALERFRATPQLQVLRRSAGLAPVSTREQDVKAVARQNIQGARAKRSDTFLGLPTQKATPGSEAAGAGMAHLLGLGPRLTSVGRYLKDKFTGEDADYQRSFDIAKEENRQLRAQDPEGAFVAEMAASLPLSAGAGKLVEGGGRLLASRGATRAGNFLQGLTQLRQGQNVRNLGKIASAGGVGGGAQALGEGENIGAGALYGAGGAAALGVGGKVVSILARPFGDMLRASNARQLIRRFTKATPEDLSARAAEIRAAGREPTLFEVLPLEDRNKLMSRAIQGQDPAVELAQERIAQAASSVGPEMRARVSRAIRPQRTAARRQIQQDLRSTGGKVPAALTDARGAVAASDSQLDMQLLRREEAGRIMQPFDEQRVVQTFEELLPDTPTLQGSTVRMIPNDPEATAAIQSVSGMLRRRSANAPEGITVRDLTDMISELGDDALEGKIAGRAAQRAIDHLRDVISENVPEAAEAATRMTNQFAARSRTLEGMGEGFNQQLRRRAAVGTSTRTGRRAENAFDTPEGATGRMLGQTTRLVDDLSGSADEALRTTSNIARGGLARELRQNIGREATDELTQAARVQDRSAGVLSQALQSLRQGGAEHIDGEAVVGVLTALHPASFITTKATALRRLMDMSYVPENRARAMVDMLFSQDRQMTDRVIRALRRDRKGVEFLGTIPGILSASSGTGTEASPDTPPPVENTEEANAFDQFDETEETGESPYEQELQDLYELEDPELLDLIDRVEQQESGGDQSAVSSAGAIGVMQVMPGTAPEAAELAGLPWDEEAYYSDPAYNKLLGIAYLSEMLRRYDGDVNLALAAYNAGPGRADEYAAGRGNLPAETQDYISKIAG